MARIKAKRVFRVADHQFSLILRISFDDWTIWDRKEKK